MERLEKRSDVAEFRRFRDCSICRGENELNMINWRLRTVQKKRVAVIEFWVYEKCGDSVCSNVVKSVPYSAEVTGGYEVRFGY
jgi:hypothetical protein